MRSPDSNGPDLLLRELVEDHGNSFWDVLHDFARSVPDKRCSEELSISSCFLLGFTAWFDFTGYPSTFLSITHTLGDRHRCVDVDLLRDQGNGQELC